EEGAAVPFYACFKPEHRVNKLFSHEKLNDPKWVGKSVPIRYDPMDNSYIAVCLGAEWVLARRREQEDKYHDVFSREEISAARFFKTKSANDAVESHQAVQSLVNRKEAQLREEVEREAEVVVQTELKPSSGLFKKYLPVKTRSRS
ncbi:Mu transposase C-terminal domain-containing protein, partial [Endozoicomonas sp. YOMI1]|uniref:Mu transposase C-terminal domain-containing protein n=1 Tax=Endozoicomonas sp. YOMI1 TaxID=2828739 RepID=UPI0021480D34